MNLFCQRKMKNVFSRTKIAKKVRVMRKGEIGGQNNEKLSAEL